MAETQEREAYKRRLRRAGRSLRRESAAQVEATVEHGATLTALLQRIATALRDGLSRLLERPRDKRLLDRLDDRMLRDVGLDRDQLDRQDTTWTWPLR